MKNCEQKTPCFRVPVDCKDCNHKINCATFKIYKGLKIASKKTDDEVEENTKKFKEKFQLRMKLKKKRNKIKPRSPVYDDVFYEGLKWLDSL